MAYVYQYFNLLRVHRHSQQLIDEYTTTLKMKYYGLEYDLGDPCLFAQGLAGLPLVNVFLFFSSLVHRLLLILIISFS